MKIINFNTPREMTLFIILLLIANTEYILHGHTKFTKLVTDNIPGPANYYVKITKSETTFGCFVILSENMNFLIESEYTIVSNYKIFEEERTLTFYVESDYYVHIDCIALFFAGETLCFIDIEITFDYNSRPKIIKPVCDIVTPKLFSVRELTYLKLRAEIAAHFKIAAHWKDFTI